MSDTSQTTNEEEIDLLDFFLILIKYRRFLMSILLPVILLLVVGYFFYPSWKYNNSPQKESVNTICKVVAGPAINAVNADFDLISLFHSSTSVLEAMKAANFEKVGGVDILDVENQAKALNWIENHFPIKLTDEYKAQNPKIVYSKAQVIKIEYSNRNPDQAEQFLAFLFDAVNRKVLETLRPHLQAIADGYEILSASSLVDKSNDKIILDITLGYAAARNVLENESTALVFYEKPYSIVYTSSSIAQYKSAYLKNVMIIFVAVLLVSLFIVYVMEFIGNLKQDDERMSKVRKALK